MGTPADYKSKCTIRYPGSTLAASMTSTLSRPAPCTFRWAPFHSGYVEISTVDDESDKRACFLVLAYGVVAYFDKEATPRKRLGLVPLQGASITPCPSGASILLKHPRHTTIAISPPPQKAEYAPFVPASASRVPVLVPSKGHSRVFSFVRSFVRSCDTSLSRPSTSRRSSA